MPNEIAMPTMFIRVKLRSLKSENGTSGSLSCWPRWYSRKTAASTADAPIDAQIQPFQSYFCPSISPNVSSSSAAEDSTTPGTSKRCLTVRAGAGMRSTAPAIASAPSGTLTKKIHRQSSRVTSRPPTVGPVAPDTPATMPHTPSAAPRLSAGKTSTTSDRVCGSSTAAPTPCTARKVISSVGSCASPQARLASVNSPTP